MSVEGHPGGRFAGSWDAQVSLGDLASCLKWHTVLEQPAVSAFCVGLGYLSRAYGSE